MIIVGHGGLRGCTWVPDRIFARKTGGLSAHEFLMFMINRMKRKEDKGDEQRSCPGGTSYVVVHAFGAAYLI